MLSIAISALAQDTTGVLRIGIGSPLGLKEIPATQMDHSLQKSTLKLAARYGYKTKNDWEDTIRYWSDEKDMRAVLFINSSYEYTTIVFDRSGKWLQTTNYLNPELRESDKVIAALDEKEYNVQSNSSPIGSIIKYRTTRDTWYEADVYENKDLQTILVAVLDKQFHFIRVKK